MIAEVAIGLGVFAVGFALVISRRPGQIKALLKTARDTGDVQPVVLHITERVPDSEQHTAWDQVLGQLWRSYDRELAASFVVVAAQHCDADIIQYWIRQITETEPAIAGSKFSNEFLNDYFQPDVAAKCGKGGCSSC